MPRNRNITIRQHYVPSLQPHWPADAKTMPITATFMLYTPGSDSLALLAGPMDTKVVRQSRGYGQRGGPIYRIEGGLAAFGDTSSLSMHAIDIHPGVDGGQPVVVVQLIQKQGLQQPKQQEEQQDKRQHLHYQQDEQHHEQPHQQQPFEQFIFHSSPDVKAVMSPSQPPQASAAENLNQLGCSQDMDDDDAGSLADAAAALRCLSRTATTSRLNSSTNAGSDIVKCNTVGAEASTSNRAALAPGSTAVNSITDVQHSAGQHPLQLAWQSGSLQQLFTIGTAIMLDGTVRSFCLGDLQVTGELCSLYDARFPDTGQICAVKVYHCMLPQQQEQQGLHADVLQQDQGHGSMDEVLQKAVQEEQGTLTGLAQLQEPCPYIVRCLGTAQVSGRPALLLPRTQSLAHFRQRCQMDEGMLRRVLAHTAAALAFLHGQGIVHGQVRACNILWREEAALAQLAGFSPVFTLDDRSRACQDPRVLDGSLTCLAHIAPEVLQGRAPMEASADVWALGCTAIELCTGRSPSFQLYPMAPFPLPAVHVHSLVAAELAGLAGVLSPAATAFVCACCAETGKRPSAAQLLELPILKGCM